MLEMVARRPRQVRSAFAVEFQVSRRLPALYAKKTQSAQPRIGTGNAGLQFAA